MDSTATVVWQGSLKQGEGKISTESGALKDSVYSFGTRFEDNPGTNPEELIAAAHASCFTMALTNELGQASVVPDSIQTSARVTLSTDGNSFKVTQSHLDVTAKIPNSSPQVFEKAVNVAKVNCPISKLLNVDITINSHLDT